MNDGLGGVKGVVGGKTTAGELVEEPTCRGEGDAMSCMERCSGEEGSSQVLTRARNRG